MAAALLLSLLLSSADGQLSEVERSCENSVQCIPSGACESFKGAVKQMKSLTKGSVERQDALDELKSWVCNKAQNGVCCQACGLGEDCVAEKDCPDFLEDRASLSSLTGDERQELVRKLKGRVCEKKSRKVCCQRGP